MRLAYFSLSLLVTACTGETDDDPVLDKNDGTTETATAGSGDTGTEYTTPDDVIDSGTVKIDCSVGPKTTGPWKQHPLSEAGATVVRKNYTDFAGGIAEVRAAAEKAGSAGSSESLPITKAIVVAKDFIGDNTSQANFWLADESGVILGWTNNDSGAAKRIEELKAVEEGDEVELTVTKVELFRDMPEISGFEGLKTLSENNDVYVLDVMDPAVEITYAEHGDDIIEVWGELASIDEKDCGGATCYNLDYGQTEPVVYRSFSEFIQVGDCIHYIGPVQQFDGETRIDPGSFDWTWKF